MRAPGIAFACGVLAAASGIACGDGGTDPFAVTVSIAPPAADVKVGETRQFTATVNRTPDDPDFVRTVTWSVVEGAAQGTVDADGLYRAPASEPPAATATVRAVSDGDPTVSATAGIHIPTAAELIDAGWQAFESGGYTVAEAAFDDALTAVPGAVEALLGRGWVRLRLGDLAGARTAFNAVLDADSEYADARAGLVLVEAGEDDAEAVLAAGEALLALAPDYAFSHDADYTVSDVRWLMARAALDAGDFEAVAGHLDALAPGHGLDPAAASFPEDALALLESLAASV